VEFEAFRVQNYKRVEDTGWIGCRDLTVLVGKNEAGKSAVLRGLSKVKPSDGEEYDGLREFPRRRFTDEFESEDWPAASVRLRLDADEQAGLRDISPELTNVTHTEVTRLYPASMRSASIPKSRCALSPPVMLGRPPTKPWSVLAKRSLPMGAARNLGRSSSKSRQR
jgi:hypothetical protein